MRWLLLTLLLMPSLAFAQDAKKSESKKVTEKAPAPIKNPETKMPWLELEARPDAKTGKASFMEFRLSLMYPDSPKYTKIMLDTVEKSSKSVDDILKLAKDPAQMAEARKGANKVLDTVRGMAPTLTLFCHQGQVATMIWDNDVKASKALELKYQLSKDGKAKKVNLQPKDKVIPIPSLQKEMFGGQDLVVEYKPGIRYIWSLKGFKERYTKFQKKCDKRFK